MDRGVHQHQRQPRAVPLAQRQHLRREDIEEAAPGLTSSSDFGPDRPMLVPSPPLSLTTTSRSSTSRARSAPARAARRAAAGPRAAPGRRRAGARRRGRRAARGAAHGGQLGGVGAGGPHLVQGGGDVIGHGEAVPQAPDSAHRRTPDRSSSATRLRRRRRRNRLGPVGRGRQMVLAWLFTLPAAAVGRSRRGSPARPGGPSSSRSSWSRPPRIYAACRRPGHAHNVNDVPARCRRRPPLEGQHVHRLGIPVRRLRRLARDRRRDRRPRRLRPGRALGPGQRALRAGPTTARRR